MKPTRAQARRRGRWQSRDRRRPDLLRRSARPPATSRGRTSRRRFRLILPGTPTFGGALFQILRRFYGTDNVTFTFVSDEFNGVTKDNGGNVRPLIPRSFTYVLSSRRRERAEPNLSWHPLGVRQDRGYRSGPQIADFAFDNFLPDPQTKEAMSRKSSVQQRGSHYRGCLCFLLLLAFRHRETYSEARA